MPSTNDSQRAAVRDIVTGAHGQVSLAAARCVSALRAGPCRGVCLLDFAVWVMSNVCRCVAVWSSCGSVIVDVFCFFIVLLGRVCLFV